MDTLKRLLATEPTLFTTAIRLTLLAAVGFGLQWSPEQIVMLLAAFEGWLAVYARMNVTPTVKAEEQVEAAAVTGHAVGVSQGRADVTADLIVLDAAQKDADALRIK